MSMSHSSLFKKNETESNGPKDINLVMIDNIRKKHSLLMEEIKAINILEKIVNMSKNLSDPNDHILLWDKNVTDNYRTLYAKFHDYESFLGEPQTFSQIHPFKRSSVYIIERLRDKVYFKN